MRIKTTADELRDEARENIKAAYKTLLSMIDPDTWGYDHYKESYMEDIEQAIIQLRKMMKKI